MPDQSESNEASGRGRGLGWVAALVVGLPLLYLLSTGPVILMMDKTNGFGGVVTWDMLREFYQPVEWLYEHTFLKQPIELYLQLWRVR